MRKISKHMTGLRNHMSVLTYVDVEMENRHLPKREIRALFHEERRELNPRYQTLRGMLNRPE